MQKAIKVQRLNKSIGLVNGVARILDFVLADREWLDNTQHLKVSRRPRKLLIDTQFPGSRQFKENAQVVPVTRENLKATDSSVPRVAMPADISVSVIRGQVWIIVGDYDNGYATVIELETARLLAEKLLEVAGR